MNTSAKLQLFYPHGYLAVYFWAFCIFQHFRYHSKQVKQEVVAYTIRLMGIIGYISVKDVIMSAQLRQ